MYMPSYMNGIAQKNLLDDWSEDQLVAHSYSNMSVNNNTDFDLEYQEDIESYLESRSMKNSSIIGS